ncbi:MAG TPA: geranyl transferase [Methylophilaceae bacterium]|nr:geranyl transferase [Methylophilaceae bacterium]
MTARNLAFDQWVGAMQARIENVLDIHMPSPEVTPNKLHHAMRYAVLGGGKRVRALLTYATGEFCGAELNLLDVPAAAAELIHAFSLVHDDMPCMDDDDLRRGKPSTHKQYDDATALLVGDALQSLAFELIATPQFNLAPEQKNQLLYLLAYATGSRGMAGGQSIDLENTGRTLNQSQLEIMHQHKTGALIRAAALMGAHTIASPQHAKLAAIDTYTQAIGLAFQVIDDILDTEADTATLGKTAGKDAQDHKSTYVTILGLDAAKKLAHDLHQQALTALSSFSDEANRLRGLADFITQRQF